MKAFPEELNRLIKQHLSGTDWQSQPQVMGFLVSLADKFEKEIEGLEGSNSPLVDNPQEEAQTIATNPGGADEQRKLELLYSFVQHSTDAFQVSTEDGRMVYINQEASKRLGIPQQEINNYEVKDFEVIFKDPGAWRAHVDELREKKRLVMEGLNRNQVTGRTFPVEVTVCHYQIRGVGFIIASSRDITLQKQIKEELILAKERAELTNKAKSDFLANMSHEIRTPLNGVIGFADLLIKSDMSPKQQQYAQTIQESAKLLVDIINDILDFSKIEAGKMELENRIFDLPVLAANTMDIVSFQARNKGLEVVLDISTRCPKRVWGDETRLRQVLINLLSNAIKFTEKGTVRLTIGHLGEADTGYTKLVFSVDDTGIGISEDSKVRIFDPFSQADSSTTRKYGGTGLGLAITNKILRSMFSELKLESEVGKGSQFFFELNLKAEKVTNDVTKPFSYKHVLVLDDNPKAVEALKNILEAIGSTLTVCLDFISALKVLDDKLPVDLIFIDDEMPYVSGLETIQRIRTSGNLLPIILMKFDSHSVKLSTTPSPQGYNGILRKPITFESLMEVVDTGNVVEGRHEDAAMSKEGVKAAKNNRKASILVAEDNMVNLFLVKTIISQILPNGIIIEARNGREAVEKFGNKMPDIVFMDIQMPILSGYEATQQIRKDYPQHHVPIIALTAGTVSGERERCLSVGMNDYVSKPIVKDDMILMLKKWLHKVETS